MKNIELFLSDKYEDSSYKQITEGIFEKKGAFFTSFSFDQEPEYEEGSSSDNISQYPLEDLLDKYNVYVSDFYEELNDGSTNTCYLEFCASDIDDIEKIHEILGKHVFNKEIEENGELVVDLVIE